MTEPKQHAEHLLGYLMLFGFICVSLAFYFVALKEILRTPYSTPIRLVDTPAFEPATTPNQDEAAAGETTINLAFLGDIMQHREQMDDSFQDSYAQIKPLLATSDLVVGNLEFPVDPGQPIGPPPQSVRFNGSPSHLNALAGAGFNVLVTANNHSFDQGLVGALSTVAEVENAGMRPVGTGATWDRAGPSILDVKGTRIAIAAYTFRPNFYADQDGNFTYWSRSWPIYELNFLDWTDEYREKGLRVFSEHVELARREGARILVAFVHWGQEWRFQPTEDQRLAARDMIDAGFDLVIGSHVHVLNPAEIYRGKLIAYSLGNVLSAFEPIEVRTSAILEVDLGVPKAGPPTLRDFRYRPLLAGRKSDTASQYEVKPVSESGGKEHARALALARRILGNQTVAPAQ